jgi:hypothetical protein
LFGITAFRARRCGLLSHGGAPLRRFVAWLTLSLRATLGDAMNDRNRARLLPVVRASALLVGLSASMFVACDSDGDDTDDPEGDPADCRLIANRCHPYDDESSLAAECHEVGHDGSSPAKCTEMRSRCLDECPPLPDAGTGGSSGASTGGGGTTSGGTTNGGSTSTGGTAGSSTGGQGETGGGAGEATGGSAGSGATTTGGSGGTSNGGTAGSGTAGGGTAGGGTGGSGGRAGGGGAAGGTGETACETLGRVCHDGAGSVAEECHNLGHDGDEPACEARFAECLAACT